MQTSQAALAKIVVLNENEERDAEEGALCALQVRHMPGGSHCCQPPSQSWNTTWRHWVDTGGKAVSRLCTWKKGYTPVFPAAN